MSDAGTKHTYQPLRVAKVIRETSDACSVVFEIPPQLREAFRYRAGQFLTLEVPYQGITLRRCYSLASSPDTEQEHKITIKRVDAGRISHWVNDQLAVGDTVRVLPPEGRFVMSLEANHMVLFAGGSGITPVISIIKTALETTARTMTLVYANRNSDAVIFRVELDRLVRDHSARLAVIHRHDDAHGFLRAEDVGALLGGRVDAEHFLCGPAAFMDTVERGLTLAGVAGERVHIERFISPADPKPADVVSVVPPSADAPTMIEMELAGTTHHVPYKGKTLLQTALDAGLDAPYSCEEGVCGCCMARLVEGQVRVKDDQALSDDEKKKGYILCCQSRPTTRTCAIKFVDQ